MKLSVIFFGSVPPYSLTVLQKLLDHPDIHVSAVITTPPSYKGRGLVLTKSDVQTFAESLNIPVFTPESLDAQSLNHLVSSLPSTPDFLIVAGFGKLIPPAWLKLPRIAALNLHPSLLPKYRGACPAEWAILNGEKETGVTLIRMDEKFDQGEIYAQQKILILQKDTRVTLYFKLFDVGADLLIISLPKIASGELKPHPQSGEPSLARKLTREDGFIPWEKLEPMIKNKSVELVRKLRAFAGWPGVWTTTPQGKRLKILSVTEVKLEGGQPQLVSLYFPKA